ncbi:CapA family protein [Pelagibius sp.]|uniref:CapA family protein n=1 Tax=Pelagibius sp. TaxID=1931238 RepID=UPI003B5010AC
MDQTLILTGDVNLQGVTDPNVVFARISDLTRSADLLFGNLECCFYEASAHNPSEREGFYAHPDVAKALVLAGFDVVGTANNVTYGEKAIVASLTKLDELGIAHTGAGCNRIEASRPAIVSRAGTKYGFLQRTSIYWPRNHEASSNAPGVAVIKGHTAYQVDDYAANRPGYPPKVVTWTDSAQLAAYRMELAALSREVDFLIASHHWGVGRTVLDYQIEIAHAAIDSGADIVLGHGPHQPLGIEIYKDRPVVYGTGCFSFDVGHHTQLTNWIGYFVKVHLRERTPYEVSIQLVRRTEKNETVLREPAEEPKAVNEILERSAALGTKLTIEKDRILVWQCSPKLA